MTLLVTSILSDGPDRAAEAASASLKRGSDAVEIRLDGWDRDAGDFAALAVNLSAGKWIVTCRPQAEGGCFAGDSRERVARLLEAAICGDGYVDFEFAEWQRSANIRQKVRLAVAQRGAGDDHEPRLILSTHDFNGRPDDPAALVAAMSAGQDLAAVKIAWQAQGIGDNLIAFDLMHEASVPVIAICMGEAGLPSRVLARKFGAFATFCAPSAGQETAPGQVTLDEMLDCYRWRSIDASTRVFGVLGDPVAHSMSPALFNACFRRQGINAVYLPLRVERAGDALGDFLTGCLARPWMHIGGFSVTVPHKEAAAAVTGDRTEALAARLGAVNTLVPVEGGWAGHNTDCAGALQAITEALDCDRASLATLQVDVLGAGGVARAVVGGLRQCGARVTVFNRNCERAERLADEFDCAYQSWDARAKQRGADLLVNCTSVGMWPEVEQTPIPAERFAEGLTVFDTVYNPLETRLLRDARQAGCGTIDGLSMFVNQAAAQFELWTEQKADRAFMRQTVASLLR